MWNPLGSHAGAAQEWNEIQAAKDEIRIKKARRRWAPDGGCLGCTLTWLSLLCTQHKEEVAAKARKEADSRMVCVIFACHQSISCVCGTCVTSRRATWQASEARRREESAAAAAAFSKNRVERRRDRKQVWPGAGLCGSVAAAAVCCPRVRRVASIDIAPMARRLHRRGCGTCRARQRCSRS